MELWENKITQGTKRGNAEKELNDIYRKNNIDIQAEISSVDLFRIKRVYERLIQKHILKTTKKFMYYCNGCKSMLLSNQIGCAYKTGRRLVIETDVDFHTMRFIEKGWNYCKLCNSEDIEGLEEENQKAIIIDKEQTLKIFKS